MSTQPFSSGLISKLKSSTGWKFSSLLGAIFTPRFFCCTNPNAFGISNGKEPVAILRLTPNPVFVGGNVSYDGSDSYDPDGSIVGYSFTFPSGTPTSSTSSTGTVTWAAAGFYEVTLVVEDGTGLLSAPARIVVEVVNPDFGTAFVGTTDNGIYLTEDSGTTWTAKNSGLSGDDLNIRSLRVHPNYKQLPLDSQVIWACTENGVIKSVDSGDTWTKYSKSTLGEPDNEFGDIPAPNTVLLDQIDLWFDENNPDKVYVLRTQSSPKRSWIYYTLNAGTTWSNDQIGVLT